MIDQSMMEGNHTVVTCTLQDNAKTLKSHALIDCGATGYGFIDEEFACGNNFPLFKLNTPREPRVIDCD